MKGDSPAFSIIAACANNRILSNGSKTSYLWDDANRLTGLTTLSANGSVIGSTTYTTGRR